MTGTEKRTLLMEILSRLEQRKLTDVLRKCPVVKWSSIEEVLTEMSKKEPAP